MRIIDHIGKMQLRIMKLGIAVVILACAILCLLPISFMFAIWMDYNIELVNRFLVLCDCSWEKIPNIWSEWLPAEGILGWMQIIALDSLLLFIWWKEGIENSRNLITKYLKHVISEE